MTKQDLPPEFLEFLKQISGKRARIVVDHILQHGFITTEDLETQYGYKHPPRAVRDVREQGVPIETFSVKNEQGRTIAAYRFGNLSQLQRRKLGGRKTFSKRFKQQLLERANHQCAVCGTRYAARYLQIDHAIPYEVAGEIQTNIVDDYMLLCGSCNRAKSWSCEHCENWLNQKNPAICQTCYWASPTQYDHIAMRPIRRIDVTFTDDEIHVYNDLAKLAQQLNVSLPDYIKTALKRYLEEK